VAEARAWGADCILIILAEVDDQTAHDLAEAAKDWGMDAIAEVHDAAELDRALKLDCRLIGINNRNLKTFEVRLETTEDLASKIPPGRIVVGESGIFTPADLQRLAKAGVNTYLVGESLMRQADVTAATKTLLGNATS
jgi:indole-3-glycerol phosphate synthase